MNHDWDAATATEQLFSTYQGDVYRYARLTLNNPTAAEDIVQEVFIRVLRSWDRYRGDSTPRTWLWAIVRNCITDYARKHRRDRHHQLFEEQLGGQTDFHTSVSFEAEQLLTVLSRDQREVVVLRLIQDWSIADTAKILKWSEAKVKTTLHRAVAKLREEEQQYG
ncbi:RNA polymerase sigma factor [Alicyclobacillus sp. ALC3]|uniref:RNA polymerase sigma factor n=1 Tax=Alicyclobacillus sp. ALC3 TaxID=2796143 RepID=UPI002379ABCD|nr:RNA polymerase sigma factor [Alicyclobacillus sp. ALC3]WDL96018.1 RNA polymerase sigma factor [Alicyclobacillus sp. ALC3]